MASNFHVKRLIHGVQEGDVVKVEAENMLSAAEQVHGAPLVEAVKLSGLCYQVREVRMNNVPKLYRPKDE